MFARKYLSRTSLFLCEKKIGTLLQSPLCHPITICISQHHNNIKRRTFSVWAHIKNILFDNVPLTTQDKTYNIIDVNAYVPGEWKDNWRITSDAEIGGKSECDLSYVNDSINDMSFIRFDGSMNMDGRSLRERQIGAGFCGISSTIENVGKLNTDYEGIEIIYRSLLNMPVLVNIGMEELPLQSLLQTRIWLKDSKDWCIIHIPFTQFELAFDGHLANGTCEGMELGQMAIESFGMTVNYLGPFQIDLHSVSVKEKLDPTYFTQQKYHKMSFLRLPSKDDEGK